MNAGLAISPELQLLLQRAEAVSEETRELMAENERWRDLAAGQLRQMYALGKEFRKRPPIEYP